MFLFTVVLDKLRVGFKDRCVCFKWHWTVVKSWCCPCLALPSVLKMESPSHWIAPQGQGLHDQSGEFYDKASLCMCLCAMSLYLWILPVIFVDKTAKIKLLDNCLVVENLVAKKQKKSLLFCFTFFIFKIKIFNFCLIRTLGLQLQYWKCRLLLVFFSAEFRLWGIENYQSNGYFQ